MVVNHEYTDEELMFPTGAYDADTIKRIAIQAHGLSVIEIERRARAGALADGRPQPAKLQPPHHRHDAFELTGPAAGDPRLQTSADPPGRRVLAR